MDIAQLFLEKSVVNGVKVMKKSFCRLCSCWSEIHGGTTPKNASVTICFPAMGQTMTTP